MRLIDADALAKVKFHGYPEIEITPSDVNAEAYKRGWNDAIDAIIESAPTIDAVPVQDGILKARKGDYVTYRIDWLLDHLAQEISLLEGYRERRKEE